MGAKRKPGPKSRKRKASTSSEEEDSAAEDILAANKIEADFSKEVLYFW